MTLQTGPEIITMYLLPSITISKGNKAMKFGQLVKYHVKYTFIQKLCKR